MFSLASAGTIAACIFLLGTFYSVVANFQYMVKEMEKTISITVFFDKDLEEYNAYEKLSIHPELALNKASNYYDLTALEKDIIVKHMYPHTKAKPKYVGSYLVSICDKLVATYEMARFKVSLRLGIYLIFIYNVVSIRMQQ